MNTGNCLYIYRQLADGNGRGNCKLLYILQSQPVGRLLYTAGRYSWQKTIESCIYTESVSWQVDTPAAPASRAQNLHGAYQPGDNPQTAARGDRLLFAGAFTATPYFNIGHKKRMHLAPFSTFYSICLESVTFKTGQQLQCYSTYTISLQLLPILYQLYCYPFIPIAICCAFVPIELIPRLYHIAILLACNTISIH